MMRFILLTGAAVLIGSGAAGAQSRPPQGAPAQGAPAQSAPAAQSNAPRPSALGNLGSNNKEPIKIDADRLDVFDKEQRAVFTGSVVAVQGESTIKCAELTVLYEQQRTQGKAAPGAAPPKAPAAPTAGTPGEGAIRRIDCKGPVTIVSKTQTATGDNAVFDRTANRILLTGNVALTEGPSVITGERIVYDLTAGVANVDAGISKADALGAKPDAKPPGRVRALFVPGTGSTGGQSQGSGQSQGQSSGQAPAPPPQGTRRAAPTTN